MNVSSHQPPLDGPRHPNDAVEFTPSCRRGAALVQKTPAAAAPAPAATPETLATPASDAPAAQPAGMPAGMLDQSVSTDVGAADSTQAGRDIAASAASRSVAAVGALLEQAQLYRLALAHHLGLSLTDVEVLNHLYVAGPTKIGDVGAALGMRSSVVSGIADRLESKGFLRRARDGQDRRHRLLELTRGDTHDDTHDYGWVVESAWRTGSGCLPGHLVRTAAAARLLCAQLEAVRDTWSSQSPPSHAPRRMR